MSGNKALLFLCLFFFSSHFWAAESFTEDEKQDNLPQYEILVAEVSLNSKPTGAASIIAKDAQGNLYVSESDLIAWEIQLPYPEKIIIEEQEFIPLAPFGQLNTELDTDNLILSISLASEAFGKRVIDLADTGANITPKSDRGYFLNYDFSLNSQSDSDVQAALYLDPVAFLDKGYITNTMLLQSNVVGEGRNILRFETRFQRDFPELRASWILGDATTATSPWSRQVRFAGAYYGSNFATQPRFISFPLPLTQGEAAVPSDIDIFVNNRLVRSVDTQPGLFEIQNVPTVTGDGEIQLIVRDALGRENVITSNFYSSDLLLKDGISKYGYGFGKLRENFGVTNGDYTDFVLVADHQYGLNDHVTLGGRIELSSPVRNFGVNGVLNVADKGVLSGSAAFSSSSIADESLSGTLLRLAYQYNNEQLRAGIAYQTTDSDFRFLGVRETTDTANSQINVNAGIRLKRYGSIGLGFVSQDFDTLPNRSITTLNYQTTIPKWFTLSAFINSISVVNEKSDTSFGLLFTRSFGQRRSANLELTQRDGFEWRSQYRQNLPFGNGHGYRVALGQTPGSEIQADWEQKLDKFFYSLESRKNDTSSGIRANLSGSVVRMGDHTSATRDVRDAFALVKVADYANIQVYQENQVIGRTNIKGELLVPGLRPYDVNKLRIEAKDLPLDAEIDAIETVVAPYDQSGVFVEFAVQRKINYSFIARHPDLDEVPPGAEILIENSQGDAESVSILGYENLVFLSAKDNTNKVILRWSNEQCTIDLSSEQQMQVSNPEAELLEIDCNP